MGEEEEEEEEEEKQEEDVGKRSQDCCHVAMWLNLLAKKKSFIGGPTNPRLEKM